MAYLVRIRIFPVNGPGRIVHEVKVDLYDQAVYYAQNECRLMAESIIKEYPGAGYVIENPIYIHEEPT